MEVVLKNCIIFLNNIFGWLVSSQKHHLFDAFFFLTNLLFNKPEG